MLATESEYLSCVGAEQAGDDGVDSVVFCIGGPHGHSEAVQKRANVTLRLSACVLNHQVRFMLTCLLDQKLYAVQASAAC